MPGQSILPPEQNPNLTETPETEYTSCFSGWKDLADAIYSSKQLDGKTFILCPGTLFNLNQGTKRPIIIEASNTRIKCGPDGSRENKCIIFGGTEHFKIIGSPSGVALEGLTMIFSTGLASVHVAGEGLESRVFFIDCEWAVSLFPVSSKVLYG